VKRLLIVANVDYAFLSHRLPLAEGARAAGWDVHVAAGSTGREEEIRDLGFTFYRLPLRRGGISFFRDVLTVLVLVRLYRSLSPRVVHHVTLKPILFGSFAARFAKQVNVINAYTGLGHAFTGRGQTRWLRYGFVVMARLVIPRKRTLSVVQNAADRDTLVGLGVVRESRCFVILGSGIDLTEWPPAPEPSDSVVMFASRLLREKGILDFVEAAALLKPRYPLTRFVVVGGTDPSNPDSIDPGILASPGVGDLIEYWGEQSNQDMRKILSECTVFVLPTYYREGLPRVLLEASATARAVVTTDTPGCNDVVLDGKTGMLVPPKDPRSCAAAIAVLLEQPDLRRSLATAGRLRVEESFSREPIVRQVLAVYDRLLLVGTGKQ
jgi:glycosyltransferase involved in cell wall biosynthesis